MDKIVGLRGTGRAPAGCCGDLVFERLIRLMKSVTSARNTEWLSVLAQILFVLLVRFQEVEWASRKAIFSTVERHIRKTRLV